jgi:hypothetical protein
MIVGTLQILKQAKLEILAEALPIPILFESRRKKLKRFLKLEILKIERIWFPCLKEMLKQRERFTIKGLIYIAIDRTSWGAINILMVSLIYDKRTMAIYWEILDKKGSSNLEEQKRVLEKILTVISSHKIVVLGDREFCSKYKCEDEGRSLSRNERIGFKSRNSTIFEGYKYYKRAGIWPV